MKEGQVPDSSGVSGCVCGRACREDGGGLRRIQRSSSVTHTRRSEAVQCSRGPSHK